MFLGPLVPVGEKMLDRAMSITAEGHVFSAAQESFGSNGENHRLEMVSWDGTRSVMSPQPGDYDDFAIASDGRRIAIEHANGESDIWIVDVQSGVRNQLTFEDSGDDPWWHPRGDSVLYVDRNSSRSQIVVRAADGSGVPGILYEHEGRISYPFPSPDFSKIVFNLLGEGVGDIWLLDVESGSRTGSDFR